MNILLSADNNYTQHCAVTMVSVLKNNNAVSFFLFTDDLSIENRSLLKKLVYSYNGSLTIIEISSTLVEKFPMPKEASDHISIATYYRLFVEKLIPINVDRVLYMDCDIIVTGNLSELWETDLNNYALGAVYQPNEWAVNNQTFRRLEYSPSYGYFNAGVLLINLEYWRNNNVTDRLFSYIQLKFNTIISHDQDTLNATLHTEVLPLDFKWNYLPSFLDSDILKLEFPKNVDYDELKIKKVHNPIVIHFVFKPKPWEYGCIHPYRKEYYKYLDLTPFKGWRPRFSFKKTIKHFIVPYAFKILIQFKNAFIKLFKNG